MNRVKKDRTCSSNRSSRSSRRSGGGDSSLILGHLLTIRSIPLLVPVLLGDILSPTDLRACFTAGITSIATVTGLEWFAHLGGDATQHVLFHFARRAGAVVQGRVCINLRRVSAVDAVQASAL